jgi:hypothetical protein
MGWSWRVPVTFQVAKYSRANMQRYMLYLLWIQGVNDYSKLKFADESHIVSRTLHKKRVLGLKNTRTYLKARTLHESSASLTILVSLDEQEPVVMTYRTDTNSQWDFLKFVLYCLKIGKLVRGDFLVVDNAAVHGGTNSWPILKAVLDNAGVQLVFLPAYSPELNPCELAFNEIKRRIRSYRLYTRSVAVEVVKAVAGVSASMMVAWYRHCIYPPVILPDLL